jgi:DNA-binding transcriptional ArsR family regulator
MPEGHCTFRTADPIINWLQFNLNPSNAKPKKFRLQFFGFATILNHMVKCSSRLLDDTFSALADPTRRRILEDLAGGDRCVTDLARPYAMSLPAVSKHLRVLERAGLIRRRRCGRLHSLKLEAEPMKQASEWIEEYRQFWEGSLDRLDDYLKQLQARPKKDETK